MANNKGISNNEQGILNGERLHVKPRAENGGQKMEDRKQTKDENLKSRIKYRVSSNKIPEKKKIPKTFRAKTGDCR
jgi:hypothetical protein